MSATDPLKSEGGRMERAAMRAYLRRQLKRADAIANATAALQNVLEWVLAREKRYGKKGGGL